MFARACACVCLHAFRFLLLLLLVQPLRRCLRLRASCSSAFPTPKRQAGTCTFQYYSTRTITRVHLLHYSRPLSPRKLLDCISSSGSHFTHKIHCVSLELSYLPGLFLSLYLFRSFPSFLTPPHTPCTPLAQLHAGLRHHRYRRPNDAVCGLSHGL